MKLPVSATYLVLLMMLGTCSAQQSADDLSKVDLVSLQKKAEHKEAAAQAELCRRYFWGRDGVEKSPDVSIPWCRLAATEHKGTSGDPDAQRILGDAFLQGLGVTADAVQSAFWFGKAAQQGNHYAEFMLGLAYQNGSGVNQYFQQAVDWYQKSLARPGGIANAMGGRCIANQPLPTAEFQLGQQYETGHGRPQDYEQAFYWYQKSANPQSGWVCDGNAQAQASLGAMYMSGRGVAWSDTEARKWLQMAAQKGNERGKTLLAKMDADAKAQAAYVEPAPRQNSIIAENAQTDQSHQTAQDNYQRELRDHSQRVADLRREVDQADAAAAEAEEAAQKAKAAAEDTSSNGSGDLGALSIALSGTVQYQAEQLAQKKRAEANRLRDKLTELGEYVVQPPPLRNSITEDAGRDRIAEARDRGINNINAAAARIQPQSQPQQQQRAASTSNQSTLPSSNSARSVPHAAQRTSSGEAAPPTCVDTGVRCIPIEEWNRMQAAKASSQSTPMICPASGFIPGVMIQHGDTAEGVPCTLGQPYNAASNSSSGAGGTQSGSPPAGGSSQRFVEPLSTSCVSMDFNGDYHWDQYFNNCGIVFNLTFDFPDGTSGLFDHFSPGKPESTAKTRAEYQGHGGNPSLYACPVDSHPVDANGNNFYKPIAKYRCVKLSYAK